MTGYPQVEAILWGKHRYHLMSRRSREDARWPFLITAEDELLVSSVSRSHVLLGKE